MYLLNIPTGAWRWGSISKCQLLLLCFFTPVISYQGDMSHIKCPRECKCRMLFAPEDGPYLRVLCPHGDMKEIPTANLDRSVYKLMIGAPPGRPNHLTIGPGIFSRPSPFRQLRELHIAYSNLPSIGIYSFWGLDNLRVLNLTYNQISSIEKENFRGLISLIDLRLSYNKIDNISSEAFRHCPNLKKLALKNNSISHLAPRLFRMLVQLHTLDLSGNPLKDLSPEVFKDIQQLTTFKCRSCMLTRVNTHIYHLAPNMSTLDLGYNRIKYVLKDDFQSLKYLRNLDLDGNQISVIVDNVFGKNRELIHLNLAHNRLALLAPNSLINITRLENLDIGYNKLERFHLQTFAPIIESLAHLTFSGNNLPLNEIALVLQIIPGVQGVGLANLSLTDIPPNFFIFNKRLVRIDLSGNKLTKFPLIALSKIKYLIQLDISYNKISGLDENDLRRLESIPEIYLSANKWQCDQCSVGTMLVYMDTTVLNSSIRELCCNSPLELQGIAMANLSMEMLEPCPSSYEAQISLIAGLLLVIVAALAAVTSVVCCLRRRAQRYDTNKRRERAHEHPDELLPQTEITEIGALSTIEEPNVESFDEDDAAPSEDS